MPLDTRQVIGDPRGLSLIRKNASGAVSVIFFARIWQSLKPMRVFSLQIFTTARVAGFAPGNVLPDVSA
jgi:hypothetical protein